jgi:hypothetical protein
MVIVAPKLPVEGPGAYTNRGVVDIPLCEMINRHSKVNLGRRKKHTLEIP